MTALSPLDATLVDELRVLPGFSRNRDSRIPCRINTYRLRACNPFIRNTYRKHGEGEGHAHRQPLVESKGLAAY